METIVRAMLELHYKLIAWVTWCDPEWRDSPDFWDHVATLVDMAIEYDGYVWRKQK